MSESSGGMTVFVTRAHAASSPDANRLRAGDRMIVGRRDTTWPEYVWCTAPDGREGWVPESLLRSAEAPGPAAAFGADGAAPQPDAGRVALALRDYDARELTVAAGVRLEAFEEAGGWLWCRTKEGEYGWVPMENVRQAE